MSLNRLERMALLFVLFVTISCTAFYIWGTSSNFHLVPSIYNNTRPTPETKICYDLTGYLTAVIKCDINEPDCNCPFQ